MKNVADSFPQGTPLSQAPLVLSHGYTPAVYGPGRPTGASSRDTGATPPATLAAQPGTGDTPPEAQSGVRGVPRLLTKIRGQGTSGFVPCGVIVTCCSPMTGVSVLDHPERRDPEQGTGWVPCLPPLPPCSWASPVPGSPFFSVSGRSAAAGACTCTGGGSVLKVEGSCWIPGSWMCRWRTTRLLSCSLP